jgi:DNA polymerase-1
MGLKGTWGFECRDLFETEFPNKNVLVDCDDAGIQLRGLAHYCDNAEYISMVSDKSVDIHKVHAEVLQCSRPTAKTFIYAFLMGAGVKKLAWVLGDSDPAKGKEQLNLFYKRFPFLDAFKKRLDKEVERGYHVALDGRLIRLNREMPHASMAVALQSFESIVMKRAAKLYQDTLKSKGIWFAQRLMVHDEFLVETHKSNGPLVGEVIANSINLAGVDLGSKCPLAGEYHVGRSWALVH